MKQGIFRQPLRALLNLAVIAVALFAILFGARAFAPSAESEEATVDPLDRATPVILSSIQIEDTILVERQFLGRVEATRSADISFEAGGTIETIPVREGDAVREGDVLARLTQDALRVERSGLEANLLAVKSQFDLAQSEADRIDRLVRSGAAQSSRLDQVIAERDILASRLLEVESAIARIDLRIKNSEIKAPFDGIIGAKSASQGETVGAGQTIASVFESGGANFRVGLPTSLDPAALQDPFITVNGTEYPAKLSAIRPDIDFRTNTRIAIFSVLSDDLNSFGLSATLTGKVSLPVEGAWVPVDAMRPSAEGYWIVLAVDDDGVAEGVAVEVQHLRDDQAYVIGALEDGAQIITGGAHKVVPGQRVKAE